MALLHLFVAKTAKYLFSTATYLLYLVVAKKIIFCDQKLPSFLKTCIQKAKVAIFTKRVHDLFQNS